MAAATADCKSDWFRGVTGEALVNFTARLFLDKNDDYLIKNITDSTSDLSSVRHWRTVHFMMDDELFKELTDSISEAGAIRRGEKSASRSYEFEDVDVRAVRAKTGLSQIQFSALLGVSPATLRNWEQGRRRPTGPARALLRIVNARPRLAMEALHADRLAA